MLEAEEHMPKKEQFFSYLYWTWNWLLLKIIRSWHCISHQFLCVSVCASLSLSLYLFPPLLFETGSCYTDKSQNSQFSCLSQDSGYKAKLPFLYWVKSTRKRPCIWWLHVSYGNKQRASELVYSALMERRLQRSYLVDQLLSVQKRGTSLPSICLAPLCPKALDSNGWDISGQSLRKERDPDVPGNCFENREHIRLLIYVKTGCTAPVFY